MSEPIDFYGVAWPRPEPGRDDLAKLRTELDLIAPAWLALADTDSRLQLDPGVTAYQRERLAATADARRNCAWELREALKGAAA